VWQANNSQCLMLISRLGIVEVKVHCELRIACACAFCVLALGRVLRMSVGFGLGFVLGVGI